MTQEETKSRNIALAAYMGWEQVNHPDTGEILSRNQGLMMYKDYFLRNPPFHEDMNLLMPVVWKLMEQRFDLVMHSWPDGYTDIGVSHDGRTAGLPQKRHPALALWEAVSSLVMELQQKAV